VPDPAEAVRQLGGMPMPGMRPRVTTKQGELIASGMVSLLVPLEPAESTAYLKFQVQRTNEPEEAREAALKYLGADYFQLPENFSDEMTAVSGAGSPLAGALLKAGEALLDFEQYAQRFRLVSRSAGFELKSRPVSRHSGRRDCSIPIYRKTPRCWHSNPTGNARKPTPHRDARSRVAHNLRRDPLAPARSADGIKP
jgi:hypothetical protein